MTVEQVLLKLEDAYPNELPRNKIDYFDLGITVGEQNVIRYIKSIIEEEVYRNRKTK